MCSLVVHICRFVCLIVLHVLYRFANHCTCVCIMHRGDGRCDGWHMYCLQPILFVYDVRVCLFAHCILLMQGDLQLSNLGLVALQELGWAWWP